MGPQNPSRCAVLRHVFLMALAIGGAASIAPAPLVAVTIGRAVSRVRGVGEGHVMMVSAARTVMNATDQRDVGVRSQRGRLL